MGSPDDEREVPEGAALMPLIPGELGACPVLLSLLHAVVFLSGSEDDIVDPDAAEEALEYIGTYLQRLEAKRLERVREDLLALTSFAKDEGWSKQDIRFLKEFLKDFGVSKDKED